MSRYADIDKAMGLTAKTMVNGTQVAYVVMGLANFVENVLNNAEVEAEPLKHGHWEFIGGYGYQYRCSECISCAERKTRFCPHCGAKMDEVENG